MSGAEKALVRPERICPEIHGKEGLDTNSEELGLLFPSHKELYNYGNSKNILSQKKAIEVMAELFLSLENEITLICTASLTNIALLFSIYPEVKSKIKEIVSMGGSMGMGNTSPVAEWNIEIDPEAASLVYGSKIPFVQVPLNVTHTALVTPTVIERIKSFNTKFSELIVDLLLFFASTYKTVFDFEFPPLHDPLAVAYVLNPEIFTTKLMNVEIETNSKYCDGCTVCDFYGTTERPKNVNVCLAVDVEKFWDLFMDCLKSANQRSPLNQNK